jgi:type IV pilus assembly protein PilC
MGEHEVFPKRLVSLVKVGEEVNQLDIFFDKIAKQYTDEIEHQTGLIGSLIEPIMIIFLGLVVGVILIAMYLPLFQLSNSFQ